MKKLLSILIASLLVLTISTAAYADETVYSEGKLYYTIENDSVTIVGSFGSDEEITVPSAIAGYPVNTIATGAFVGRTALKEVYLPETIMTVEEGAFPPGVTVNYSIPKASDEVSSADAKTEDSDTGEQSSENDEESNGSYYSITPGNITTDVTSEKTENDVDILEETDPKELQEMSDIAETGAVDAASQEIETEKIEDATVKATEEAEAEKIEDATVKATEKAEADSLSMQSGNGVWIIVGIIAAVVAVAVLLIVFIRKKRG